MFGKNVVRLKQFRAKKVVRPDRRRQPCLKRLSTKAKFNHDSNHKVKRCNRPNCGLCIHLLESNSFEFNCGKRFFVHESMTCEVKNVVYVMKCRGCGDEYIGETGNFLRKRITVHSQQIRDPKNKNTLCK